jgi:hypothetical protein
MKNNYFYQEIKVTLVKDLIDNVRWFASTQINSKLIKINGEILRFPFDADVNGILLKSTGVAIKKLGKELIKEYEKRRSENKDIYRKAIGCNITIPKKIQDKYNNIHSNDFDLFNKNYSIYQKPTAKKLKGNVHFIPIEKNEN